MKHVRKFKNEVRVIRQPNHNGSSGITYSPDGPSLKWTDFPPQYLLNNGITLQGPTGGSGTTSAVEAKYATVWNTVQGNTLVFVDYTLPVKIPALIPPTTDLVKVKMPLLATDSGYNTATIGPRGTEVALNASVANYGYNWVTASTKPQWLYSGSTNVNIKTHSIFYQQNLLSSQNQSNPNFTVTRKF